MKRQCLSLLSFCFAAIASVGGEAAAQDTAVLERFTPSPAGDVFFAVRDAAVSDKDRLSAQLLLGYARQPRFYRQGPEGELLKQDDFVTNRWTSHLLVSLESYERLELEMALPVVLGQAGEVDESRAGPASPSGPALSDLRLSATVELVPQLRLIPGVSSWVAVQLPTGDETAYAGAEGAQLALGASLGAQHNRFVYGAHIGAHRQERRSRVQEVLSGDLSFGVGAAFRTAEIQLGAELFGATAANDSTRIFKFASTSAEALLSARWRRGDWTVGAAGGPALHRGAGAPSVRVLASVSFSPERFGPEPPAPPASQPRELELVSFEAQTPAKPRRRQPTVSAGASTPAGQQPEPAAGAPLGAEPSMGAQTCPRGSSAPAGGGACVADRDADGIPDVDDRCPTEPGVRSSRPVQLGCPRDSDADGVPDSRDACPSEAGASGEDPKTSGCPSAVRVSDTKIVIMQRAGFDVGLKVIAAESLVVLEQVVEVMAAHPEITRLAIDGHTDNVGQVARNTALSRKRAVAVMRWLVDHGVDERRLEARGFGPHEPVADNETEEGRAKNRRVEFTILRRSSGGKAAWKDGPASEQ